MGLRAVLALTRALPRIIEQSGSPLTFSVILLDDDRDASENLARRISPHLGEGVGLGYSAEGRDGPGIYGLNRNVPQTILFARDGVVTRSFAFQQGAAYADPHVLGALAELVGADRDTFAAWMARIQAEDARPQRLPRANRPGERPEFEDRPGPTPAPPPEAPGGLADSPDRGHPESSPTRWRSIMCIALSSLDGDLRLLTPLSGRHRSGPVGPGSAACGRGDRSAIARRTSARTRPTPRPTRPPGRTSGPRAAAPWACG
ncbi:hypothetical protein ElP_55550 [Tautonia plasticadhaerens]|uniref:Uncharacterized protein n=1 Tax=Tautonia plasticadhaerens TaxID=2527974 RepID=A0A518H9T8_9BACT|nr:hypothetical protein ElP_55550 [Tautonia plasticadhaerens]